MKHKLRLLVEELHVEQFQVEPAVAANRGTVHGFDDSDDDSDAGCYGTGDACTGGCTAVGCTQYCGASTNPNTAPCFLCPRRPYTDTCNPTDRC